jgi:SAM-dependent methyltransferase
VLDVGCGPGALTAEFIRRLGAAKVCAIDPSERFVEACGLRNPGVQVLKAVAEKLPYDDAMFDAALAQLVLHFAKDPRAAVAEMRRVVRRGGAVAACVWDFSGGMRMLRAFWDAALAVDADAPDELVNRAFGREGELCALFASAGFAEVTAGALVVEASYAGFDELWGSFLGRVGPVGEYCASLSPATRRRCGRSSARSSARWRVRSRCRPAPGTRSAAHRSDRARPQPSRRAGAAHFRSPILGKPVSDCCSRKVV